MTWLAVTQRRAVSHGARATVRLARWPPPRADRQRTSATAPPSARRPIASSSHGTRTRRCSSAVSMTSSVLSCESTALSMSLIVVRVLNCLPRRDAIVLKAFARSPNSSALETVTRAPKSLAAIRRVPSRSASSGTRCRRIWIRLNSETTHNVSNAIQKNKVRKSPDRALEIVERLAEHDRPAVHAVVRLQEQRPVPGQIRVRAVAPLELTGARLAHPVPDRAREILAQRVRRRQRPARRVKHGIRRQGPKPLRRPRDTPDGPWRRDATANRPSRRRQASSGPRRRASTGSHRRRRETAAPRPTAPEARTATRGAVSASAPPRTAPGRRDGRTVRPRDCSPGDPASSIAATITRPASTEWSRS